jgi:REP element-mobilizing transposase RayT
MPQSLALIYVHWVFSTKHRHLYFRDPSARSKLHSVLGGKAKSLDCNPIIVGGVADHVHLLTTLSRMMKMSEFVKEVKTGSTEWVKQNLGISRFHWQSGYGAFSVSHSQLDIVKQYLANQEAWHQKLSFQDEFRSLLMKHQVEFDERYVWD